MPRFDVMCSLAALLVATTASAQVPGEGTPAPAPSPPPVVQSDHDLVVHHLAVGYFGISLLPIAVPPSDSTSPPTGGTVTAPAVGARYWFSRRFGLDAAVGVGLTTGSSTVNSASSAAPTTLGVAVHLGAPIALLSASHYVFEVTPETVIGWTTGNVATANQQLGGFLFNVGARVGAEIHFGFIGIPQLALQSSVALYFSHQSFWSNQAGVSSSVQSNTLSTSEQASPWAIFTDTLSGLYYF